MMIDDVVVDDTDEFNAFFFFFSPEARIYCVMISSFSFIYFLIS